MAEEFFTREFDNGLTLVAQRMPGVSSSAVTIALPAGSAHDPPAGAGAASTSAFWLLRGAGGRDTHQINDVLDSLGCQHHEAAHSEHLLVATAQLGRNLPKVLEVYADILRRPSLSDETFCPCRDLVAQALDSLEDEPMRNCHVLVRDKFYPSPLGRNPLGTKESLAALKGKPLRSHLKDHLTPSGAIMAVAGKLDWEELSETVEKQFGDWAGPAPAEVSTSPAEQGVTHISKETAQVQITLAYPAATIDDELYYAARVTQMILSGGMGARLFTEVREKRALVYAVMARYHNIKGYAGMFVYAGTTPQRAQETLDVTVGELRCLSDGVGEDELARARTQLKSALIMQGESTSARADALAGDFYHLGRLRGLEEISAAIDAVTVDDVMEYVHAYPADNLTILTIGPDELKAPGPA
ncbi:MAG: pitrilysin family protein [Planctomycetota bacterium]|nr:pitrilysin family protein [Planctomycetota bacterium]